MKSTYLKEVAALAQKNRGSAFLRLVEHPDKKRREAFPTVVETTDFGKYWAEKYRFEYSLEIYNRAYTQTYRDLLNTNRKNAETLAENAAAKVQNTFLRRTQRYSAF